MAFPIFGFEAMNRANPDFRIAIATICAHYLNNSLATRTSSSVALKPLSQAFIMEDMSAI